MNKQQLIKSRLTEAAIAASRATHATSKQQLAEDILAIPTAANATRSYTLPLSCVRTGIVVGSISVATVAGHMPMIGQWKESMVLHPLFSLQPVALLHFAKNSWFRFCAFSDEETLDEIVTAKQELLLRVAALGLLHQLTDVRQDIPWMPSWADVSRNWSSLLGISYWKNYLESQRFKFPSIHISKLEPTLDLHEYLQLCWKVKKNYETKVNERIEQEKLDLAEKAIKVLRDDLAGKTPRSTKLLWRWFLANLPTRYEADSEGWMRTIFFSKLDDNLQNTFTMADIDLFEEIFLSEVPTGSSISHAFLEILRSKRTLMEQHFETFEILVPQNIQDDKASGVIPATKPVITDFPNKFAFMIAEARWKLAHTKIGGGMAAALEKQQQTTVKASFIPRLVIREEEPQEFETDETVEDLDGFGDGNSDAITGEIEE